jgi:hypothetical protein
MERSSSAALNWEIGLGQDNSPPPVAERRPKSRKRVLLTGIIAYGNGAHSFHCTFRNLSETGARLTVGHNAQFPSDFYLINIRDRVAYDAKLVWNRGGEIGITFKHTIPLAGIADPALAFLKQLWLTKA